MSYQPQTNGQAAPAPQVQRPGISRSTLPEPDAQQKNRYFGKYRGTVISNLDPTGEGKLQVNVPGISLMNWATPCVPFAYVAMGMWAQPPVGANVWIEFEKGDPDLPIWCGSWWGEPLTNGTMAKQAQLEAPELPAMTFETATAGIGICDIPLTLTNPGQVVLQAAEGAVSIALTPAGVTVMAPAGIVSFVCQAFNVVADNITIA
jgi:hypothetical protein